MSKPSAKRKKQAAEKPSPPKAPPPTHILLTIDAANAIITRLGEVPHKFDPHGMIATLRGAKTVSLPSTSG